MSYYEQEVRDLICELTVDCPACQNIEDPQYTCTVCWCMGGNGTISVVDYILENQEVFKCEF